MSAPDRSAADVEQLVSDWLTPAGADTPLDVLPAEDLDPEILDGFVLECADLLEEAEHAILRLETQPDDESVATIFRCFHTIKGTAAFLALDHVSAVAHDAESVLEGVRENLETIDVEVVNLLIRAIDVLAECARAAGAGEPVPVQVVALQRELRSAAASAGTTGAAEGGPGGPIMPVAAETRAAESWTRVRTDRLDRLLETVGEMVVTQSMLREAGQHESAGSALADLVVAAGKNVRALQELSVGMRLVPLRSLFHRMERLVRDLGRKSGKAVRLVTEGADTEIDRNLIEELADPLLHMLRNAVDHGIEAQDERRAAGKSEIPTIRLQAYHRGSNVVVVVSDDGRGIDTARVRRKAVQRGWLSADRPISDAEVLDLIFRPGFSTADAVSELSGRGVGLDVVRRNLEVLAGHVQVVSTPGSGCSFEIEVPLTLAVTDGMLIGVGDERFILPLNSMLHSFRAGPDTIRTVTGRGEMVVLPDGLVPLVRLGEQLGSRQTVQPGRPQIVVLVAAGERRGALLVDALVGQQQVVAKPLAPVLAHARGVSGSAILGDGRVGLILDVPAILEGRVHPTGALQSSPLLQD